MKSLSRQPLIILLLFFLGTPLFASGAAGGGLTEKMTELIFQVGIILFAARLGGMIMKKINMPSVLGEPVMGIIIGSYLLGGLGWPGFPHGLFPLAGPDFPVTPELYALATVASIILLFHSGLETDLALFLRFSLKGAIIGIGGVIVSFLSGAWAGSLMTGLPLTAPVNLFLGVLSIATSVGITARILSEQRKMDSPEGVTILAAAVIDDVLGIIILAVILGIVSVVSGHGGDSVPWGSIGLIALKAVGVWLGFTILGLLFARKIGNSLKFFRSETTIAVMSLGLALILSGIFEKAGLAMIIGAYVMGLSLSRTDLSFIIQEKLHPLQEFFVPVFFCVMGMLVNVTEFLRLETILFGLLFSALGMAAKIIGCGVPSLFLNFNLRGALRIGVGMVPRGEVALIIAGIGIAGGILTETLFGVAVFMTLVTTLVPPPLLTRLLKSEKMGTRTPTKGSNTVISSFTFPSREMTQMAVSKALEELKEEGFYIHEMDVDDHRIYQNRKEEISLTFHEYTDLLEVVSDPADQFFVKNLVYESLVGMHETINKLKDMTKPVEMKKSLTEEKGARIQDDFFKNLQEGCIATNLQGNDKDAIIEEMVGLINQAGLLDDHQACLQAVREREDSMSTGMQNGTTRPHGKSEGISRLAVAIGLKPEGIDFNALDRQPSKIFIMTISPKNSTGPHIQFLTSVSAILNKPRIVDRVLECRTPAEVKELFIREAQER